MGTCCTLSISELVFTKAYSSKIWTRLPRGEYFVRVGIVKRSQATMLAIYGKLRIVLARFSKEDRLSMTFRAIKDAPNSDTNICPTTLVFGIHPKIPGAGHSGSLAQRANIIRETTNMVIKMKARRFLRDFMRTNNSPSMAEIVAAWNYQHDGLFTSAPTINRISHRLRLAVSVSARFDLFTRDVTKAFVNSKTSLRRAVYLRPPSEMNLEKGKVLKVDNPLYGIPEAPIHWFKMYLNFHRDGFKMEQVPTDPCLLYHCQYGVLQGIIGLQVDDTLFEGTAKFAKIEEAKAREFPTRDAWELSTSRSVSTVLISKAPMELSR